MKHRRRAISSGHATAFTLIEVTISVALALVLMLGIAQVFRITGDTIGTGEALAIVQRDARATQTVMASDFNAAVTDTAPFMTLYSRQIFAYRNPQDLAGAKRSPVDPSYADPLGTGTESQQPAAIYNDRSHRIDALTFFGRGMFNRQTGADVSTTGASPFVSNMKCAEAMLWYGHLNLADNAGSFTATGGVSNNTPGVSTQAINPNNYFATSWILGRQQTLLQNRSYVDNNGATLGAAKILDSSYPTGNDQYAYNYTSNAGNLMPALAPLNCTSIAYPSSTPGTGPLALALQPGTPSASLLSGRIDLAATSIALFRNTLSTDIPSNTYPSTDTNWFQKLPAGTNGQRFQAQPFFLTTTTANPTKITPESMAYQTPIFVRGCTQFTVEYAGDYLYQDPNTGAVTDTYAHVTGTPPAETAVVTGATDGLIDYIPVSGTGQNMVRKIRWYGLPRSTTNNATISGVTNGDVAPLRDIWATATSGTEGPQAPFEVKLPSAAVIADYAPQASGLAANAEYICAWGPNDPKPKMIRITMTVDDPGGRLGDAQTYEYIYTLP